MRGGKKVLARAAFVLHYELEHAVGGGENNKILCSRLSGLIIKREDEDDVHKQHMPVFSSQCGVVGDMAGTFQRP